MAINKVVKSGQQEQIYEMIAAEIKNGTWKPGMRLPPIKELAFEFGTSVFPVHQALSRLQKKGVVVLRHGDGTYVADKTPAYTMSDAVVMAFNTQGHLFADLGAMLGRGLRDAGKLILNLDLADEHSCDAMMERAIRSDAEIIIIHGNQHFKFGSLQNRKCRRKSFISLLDWDGGDLPGLHVHKVLIDHQCGARAAAGRFWGKGIRRVLLLGSENMVRESRSMNPAHRVGPAFCRAWSDLGGSITYLSSGDIPGEPDRLLLDTKVLIEALSEKEPTAIFAIRDLEGWTAQSLLLQHAPQLLAQTEIIGYGDTPWSRAGHPPFPSFNWRLEEVAAEAVKLVKALGENPAMDPVCITIEPKLAERSQNP